MNIPTAVYLDPLSADLAKQLLPLRNQSGIYALVSRSNVPHISWCFNLERRLTRLLVRTRSAATGPMERLRNRLSRVECWPTGSKLETSLLLYALVRLYFPEDYLRRLKLRMPWFVALTSSDPFPRLTVINRIPRNADLVLGPFSSREIAQQYEQELSGLYQLRRCTETLMPHIEHPGCIYGEMNQCMRPCQCAVSQEEYQSEVQRVSEFLLTNGKNSIASLALARDRAASETDFEQAAFLHKRLEKLKNVAGVRDDVVSDVRKFNGIVLSRGIQSRRFRLWPMLDGYWQEPITISVAAEEAQAKSLDRDLRENMEACVAGVRQNGNSVEHLALFSRWYYSSWRDGQWFPFRILSDLNYRKLVREISNLVKADSRAPEG